MDETKIYTGPKEHAPQWVQATHLIFLGTPLQHKHEIWRAIKNGFVARVDLDSENRVWIFTNEESFYRYFLIGALNPTQG